MKLPLLSEKVNMPLFLIAVALQVVNIAEPWLSEDWKMIVAASLGLGKAVLLKIGYNSNPDGTKNTVAYEKPYELPAR